MIGTVLHLMGRVVDRARGADVASLRVKVAALSARVVATEGEVERLRGEAGHWRDVVATVERNLAKEREEVERLRAGGEVKRYACPCCKGPHALPVECAWKPLAEQRRKECDEARAEVERLRGLARAYKRAEDAYYAAKGDARTPARAVLHEAVDALFAAVPKEAP